MFIIKDHVGYVVEFSSLYDCVLSGKTRQMAKMFKTYGSAVKFINTYGNAGYGLVKSETTIIEIK